VLPGLPLKLLATNLPTEPELVKANEPSPETVLLAIEEEKKTRKRKAFRPNIWVEVSPTFSYSQINPTLNDAIVITSLNSNSAISTERLGGQASVGISKPIAPNFSLQAGASYWYQPQNLSYTYYDSREVSYQSEVGYDAGTGNAALRVKPVINNQARTIEANLHNVGVNTSLSWRTPTKKAITYLNLRLGGQYSNLNEFSSYGGLSYLVAVPLPNNLDVRVGPAFNYNLWGQSSLDAHFNVKPYSFGFSMSVGIPAVN
jgi:hypothetical protein